MAILNFIRCRIRSGQATILLVAAALAIPSAFLIAKNHFFPGMPESKGGAPNVVESNTFPLILRADQVLLPEEEPVIGVALNGRHRAYRIAALTNLRSHVFNDVIDGTPVTATYCDRADCTQVFTAETAGRPLVMRAEGFDGQMMVEVEGQVFWQHTGHPVDVSLQPEFELSLVPHVRTSWGKWRDAHPKTDVYIGPVYLSRW